MLVVPRRIGLRDYVEVYNALRTYTFRICPLPFVGELLVWLASRMVRKDVG